MATPGWYPDPSGQPQMFRYWNGSSWSEQTTSDPSSPAPGAPVPPPAPAAPTQVTPSAYPQQPADPFQQQYQQQYAAQQPQPGQYGGGGYGGQGYPGAPGSSGGGSGKKALLIALAVLLIAGLAVGGFFGVRALTDDDGDDSASDDTSQSEETDDESESPTDETESPTESPTDEPTESPTDTGPTGQECTGGLPAGGEVSGDGSISGGDLTLPPVKGYSPLEPQITTTFAFADEVAGVGKSIEELWISLYAVGGLPKASGYSDLEASVDQVIDCMTESPNFYRNFSGREDIVREAIQVDGHDAYAVTSEIRVDDPEIEVDGDYSKVIVVDTGDDEHFGLYVAVVPIGDQTLIDRLEAASAQLLVDD